MFPEEEQPLNVNVTDLSKYGIAYHDFFDSLDVFRNRVTNGSRPGVGWEWSPCNSLQLWRQRDTKAVVGVQFAGLVRFAISTKRVLPAHTITLLERADIVLEAWADANTRHPLRSNERVGEAWAMHEEAWGFIRRHRDVPLPSEVMVSMRLAHTRELARQLVTSAQ